MSRTIKLSDWELDFIRQWRRLKRETKRRSKEGVLQVGDGVLIELEIYETGDGGIGEGVRVGPLK